MFIKVISAPGRYMLLMNFSIDFLFMQNEIMIFKSGTTIRANTRF